jgi:zinc D-Ala-D-Ala carboxypeptidase
MPRYLSPHFSLDELVASQTAARKGIDNTPGAAELRNLKRLALVLEQVREAVGGKSVLISSGYRSPALNKAVGGAKNSAHMLGLAADFSVPSFGTLLQVAKAIAGTPGIEYDQLIHEYGTWVHIGLAADGVLPKRENMSIFNGTGYLAGLISAPKMA